MLLSVNYLFYYLNLFSEVFLLLSLLFYFFAFLSFSVFCYFFYLPIEYIKTIRAPIGQSVALHGLISALYAAEEFGMSLNIFLVERGVSALMKRRNISMGKSGSLGLDSGYYRNADI